jgi:hypothetical protein
MKRFLKFLCYFPLILLGVLGAYIVFHMWQLTEIGHGAASQRHAVAGNDTSPQAEHQTAAGRPIRSTEDKTVPTE